MSGYYLSATNRDILAMPRSISDGALAVYFGISVERVTKVRTANPEKPGYRTAQRDRNVQTEEPVLGASTVADAKVGSAMLLQGYVRYAQKHHPKSDLARLVA